MKDISNVREYRGCKRNWDLFFGGRGKGYEYRYGNGEGCIYRNRDGNGEILVNKFN
jgi:hypothetical protein